MAAGGSEEMEDVKTMFEVNVGQQVVLNVLGERNHIAGEVEEAFENYVSLLMGGGTKFCVLYQGIVSVELHATTQELSSFI